MRARTNQMTWARAHRWVGAALATTLVAAMLASAPTADAATAGACDDPPLDRSFSDTKGVLADAVACIAGYGIVGGYPDGTFRPNDPVTRAESSKFLTNFTELADGAQLPDAASNPFNDVATGGVFGRFILRLARAGIVEGTSSTRFSPNASLSRGQMTAVVGRTLGELGVPLDDTDVDYPDVPDDGFFAPTISELTNAKIVGGYPDGTFRPNAPVTRAELAAFLARSAQYAADHGAFLPVAGPIGAGDWSTLRGSLEHARTSRRISAGPQVINVLRWDLNDPRVRLSADYAGSAVSPATVLRGARRTGAVAAVNGGFWRPGNDPNGLLVDSGSMVSDPSVWQWWISDDKQIRESQYRSAFGLHPDGTPVLGEVQWNARMTASNGAELPFDAINRHPWGNRDDGALYFTRNAIVKTLTDTGYYFVLDGVANLNQSGNRTLTIKKVIRNSRGPVTISSGESAVFVPSANAEGLRLGHLGAGDTIRVDVAMDPDWEGTRTALVGGPLLLVNNSATSRDHWWNTEAFEKSHTDNRHPRTAIGFTGDGQGVIVTVDGRRPGASIGMSTSEVINYIRDAHGVRDAVMMDGGGSTQMVLGNHLGNRPCCDSSLRRVATAMFFEPT